MIDDVLEQEPQQTADDPLDALIKKHQARKAVGNVDLRDSTPDPLDALIAQHQTSLATPRGPSGAPRFVEASAGPEAVPAPTPVAPAVQPAPARPKPVTAPPAPKRGVLDVIGDAFKSAGTARARQEAASLEGSKQTGDILMAPAISAAKLGLYAGQRINDIPDARVGATPHSNEATDNELSAAMGVPQISNREGAVSAAQLAAIGFAGPLIGKLAGKVTTRAAQELFARLSAAEPEVQVAAAEHIGNIVGHGYEGATIGAAYDPDKPLRGAAIGGALGAATGIARAIDAPSARRPGAPPADGANLSDHPDRLLQGRATTAEARSTAPEPPAPTEPDYTVGPLEHAPEHGDVTVENVDRTLARLKVERTMATDPHAIGELDSRINILEAQGRALRGEPDPEVATAAAARAAKAAGVRSAPTSPAVSPEAPAAPEPAAVAPVAPVTEPVTPKNAQLAELLADHAKGGVDRDLALARLDSEKDGIDIEDPSQDQLRHALGLVRDAQMSRVRPVEAEQTIRWALENGRPDIAAALRHAPGVRGGLVSRDADLIPSVPEGNSRYEEIKAKLAALAEHRTATKARIDKMLADYAPADEAPAVFDPKHLTPAAKVAAPSDSAGDPLDQLIQQHQESVSPKQAPEGVPTPEGGVSIVRVPTDQFVPAPEMFQYKRDTKGPSGATSKLSDVRQFDERLAGVGLAWRNPATGIIHPVNMHHRLDLAVRTNHPSLNVIMSDAKTPEEAKAEGAVMNMAEGTGTALDAANFFRTTGYDPSALAGRVSLKGAIIRHGINLSKLTPDLFAKVETGDLSEAHGSAIGEVLSDPAQQRAAAQAVAGKRLSEGEVKDVARQVRDAGNEGVQQESLFGQELVNKSLFVEKAQLATLVKKRLGMDKRLFGFVAKGTRGEELARGGNVIDTEKSKAIADQAGQLEEIFSRLYTTKGPISDALTQAAREVANGAAPKSVIESVYPAIRDAIAASFTGSAGGVRASGEPSGPDDTAGNHPTAEGDAGQVKDSDDPSQNAMFERSPTYGVTRQYGIPKDATHISSAVYQSPFKAHADFHAAKAGDVDAAARFIMDRIDPKTVQQAREQFGPDVVYVAPTAIERTGANAIPQTMADYYAAATGAEVDTDIVQANRAFHTGARDAMERILSPVAFDGPVQAGRRYVLVDDVVTSGGTLAALASHIQEGGGKVAGVVSLAHTKASIELAPSARIIEALERRYGNVIRTELGLEPSTLTAAEAQSLIGAGNADDIRNRATAAREARAARTGEPVVRPYAAEAQGVAERGADYDLFGGEEPKHEEELGLFGGDVGKASTAPKPTEGGFTAKQKEARERADFLRKQLDRIRNPTDLYGNKRPRGPVTTKERQLAAELAQLERIAGFDQKISAEELKARATAGENDRLLEESPKYGAQTDTPEFKRWFGDSKVVDADGKPLQVYHGTSSPKFDSFDRKSSTGLGGQLGFWFASEPHAAEQFMRQRYAGEYPAMYPVFLSIQKPMVYHGYAEFREHAAKLEKGRSNGRDSITQGIQALRRHLTRRGYDGVIIRGSDTDMGGVRDDYVAFDPKQIKSSIANRGTFDPSSSNILKEEAQKYGEEEPKLAVLHNTNAEKFLFADKVGGMPVPSLGIAKAGGAYPGMGDITLIGKPHLGDPTQEPIHDADVYSQTFPSAEYKKAKHADAMALMAELEPFAKLFDDSVDRLYSRTVEKADPQAAISDMLYMPSAQAAFLASKGKIVKPAMRDATVELPWVDTKAWKAFAPEWNTHQHAYGDPEYIARADAAARAGMEEYIAKHAAGDADIADTLREAFTRLLERRGGAVGASMAIERSMKNVGRKDVDSIRTRERLERAMKGLKPEFKEWVESKVLPMHGQPFLTLDGKKVPFTLENITEKMKGRIKASQKTVTFGPGNARAASATRFREMRHMKNAAGAIGDAATVETGRAKAQEALKAYVDAVLPYSKEDTWSALDAAHRALAKYASGGSLVDALRKEWFRSVPAEVLELGKKASLAMKEAPVPYFEAKPQRTVTLDEFAGAVVPKGTDPKVLAALEKHGIQVEQYRKANTEADPYGETSRSKAVATLQKKLERAGKGVVFEEAPKYGEPEPPPRLADTSGNRSIHEPGKTYGVGDHTPDSIRALALSLPPRQAKVADILNGVAFRMQHDGDNWRNALDGLEEDEFARDNSYTPEELDEARKLISQNRPDAVGERGRKYGVAKRETNLPAGQEQEPLAHRIGRAFAAVQDKLSEGDDPESVDIEQEHAALEKLRGERRAQVGRHREAQEFDHITNAYYDALVRHVQGQGPLGAMRFMSQSLEGGEEAAPGPTEQDALDREPPSRPRLPADGEQLRLMERQQSYDAAQQDLFAQQQAAKPNGAAALRAEREEANIGFGSVAKRDAALKRHAEVFQKIAALKLPTTEKRLADVQRHQANQKSVNVIGMRVRPNNLHSVMDLLRDPLMEHFHVFYLGDADMAGEREILHHTADTVGALSMASVPDATVDGMIATAKRLNAVVAFGHNHPSGNATASMADVQLTAHIAARMRNEGIEFRGHTIIDHGEYAHIKLTPDGKALTVDNKQSFVPRDADYETAEEAKLPRIADPKQAAAFLKQLTGPNHATILVVDTNHRVIGVTPKPLGHLLTMESWLPNLLETTGGVGVLIAAPDAEARALAQRAIGIIDKTAGAHYDMATGTPNAGSGTWAHDILDVVAFTRDGHGQGVFGRGQSLPVRSSDFGKGEANIRRGVGGLAVGGVSGDVRSSPEVRGGGVAETAFHGTPHEFDKFSLQHIGSGEGNQSFGWGLYFAGKKALADHYRTTLSRGQPLSDEAIASLPPHWTRAEEKEFLALNLRLLKEHNLPAAEMDRWRHLKNIDRTYEAAIEKARAKGKVYTVDIPGDDELLHWDKPLAQQPPKVKAALESLARPQKRVADMTREELIKLLSKVDRNGSYTDEESIREFGSPATREDLLQAAENMELDEYLAESKISPEQTGSGQYDQIVAQFGSPKAASEALAAAGVHGIKYLNGQSRNLPGAPSGDPEDYNYVIFDDSKINIKGVEEKSPKYGQEEQPDQTSTPAFKKWFGNSKVVDHEGKPLVVYHGTDSVFSEFKNGDLGFHFGTQLQAHSRVRKIGMTNDDMRRAVTSGEPAEWMHSANMMPVYLKLEYPLRATDPATWNGYTFLKQLTDNGIITKDERNRVSDATDRINGDARKRSTPLRELLQSKGYDGIVYENKHETEGDSYIVFEPNQVKSATGNSGAFDPSNPSIVAEDGPTYGEGDDEPQVGIKNADSAAQRERLGMDQRIRPEPRTQDEMYEAGKRAIEADPTALPRILKELEENPERIVGTQEEAGILLKHRVDLENKLNRLLSARDQAAKDGDEAAAHLARLQLGDHREQMSAFIKLMEQTGTATGRALAARKMMSKLDYSLGTMEAMSEAAKGQSLTEAELARVRALHTELQEKLAAVEKDAAAARERAAQVEAELHHAQMKLEVAGPLAERLTAKLETAAEAAMRRIKARGLRASAGMDPIDLADHAIIGAAAIARGARKFAAWSDEMLSTFGEGIGPHLEEIFAEANKKLDAEIAGMRPKPEPKAAAAPADATKRTRKGKSADDILAALQERVAQDGDLEPAQLQPYLQQMALAHIRAGITEREPLLDRLHKDVQKALPDATREEVRDALSGYGQFYPLDKRGDKVRLREIKAESQKLAQLEALQRGEAPLATGVERQAPNDETRRLTKQVNDAKKAAGILSGMDQAARLKSALGAAKTRTRNAIRDLQTEIDTGNRMVKGKSTLLPDKELTMLRDQLAELRRQEKEVFGTPTLTPEQRLRLATAAAKRNAIMWNDRLVAARKGEFAPSRKPQEFGDPILDALRANAKAAREAYKELEALDPAHKAKADAQANASYRRILAQREAELLDRMARQDYAPRLPKPARIYDAETMKKKADVEAVKQKFQDEVRKWEKANRTLTEKVQDSLIAYVRAGALSWPTVIFKLSSVALSRIVTTPLTDLVGVGVANLLPALAEGAPRHGTKSFRVAMQAEAAALTAMVTEGLQDSGRMLRNQVSSLDLQFAKHKEPHAWYEYAGSLHGALKEPIKRAEFARSLYRRTVEAMERGEDTTSEFVQLRLQTEAFLDAQRAIAMNDNAVVSAWNNGLRALEQKSKATGKPNPAAKLLATALRVEMPIVKAPTNVIFDASEYIHGWLVGPARAAWAYAHGLEDLAPVERDSIIRMISKGLVGLAIMSLYFYKHDKIEFGGFYRKGEKRKPNDVPVGGAKIYGKTVEKMWLHNPLFMAGQFAAAIARVAPTRHRKKDKDPVGYWSAFVAANIGLAEEIPFAGSLVRDIETLKDGADEWMAKKMSSIAVPGVVQWVARKMDDDRKDPPDGVVDRILRMASDKHVTRRKPEGLKQNLENNLPGLRDRVPLAKK